MTDQTQVAYDLQGTSAAAESSLGLVLVSNQPPADLELDPRSQSRVSYQPLEVRPYTEQDLVKILHDRVAQAFHQDIVADDAIDRIAAIVAAENGDCREILTLLLRAARLAEHENADTVTVKHVEQITTHKDGNGCSFGHD